MGGGSMSNEAERLCNKGLELMSQHRWVEAEEKMTQAVNEDNQSPELWYNLGKCRFHQDDYDGAILSLIQAVDLKKFYHEAHALLGNCYYAIHDIWKAKDHFTSALSVEQDDFTRECMTARAHCYLAMGEYTVGFEEYEYRLAEANTWNGTESLVGKTLLVKAEGGLGDQIFFARYAIMLGQLGAGYVLWEVDEPLVSYMNRLKHVVVRGKETPEHDYMVHAGSLPYIFGTKKGTIPVFSDFPCHVVNPKRIGIACSGNPLHPDDHHRSIPLAEFEPLFELDKDFRVVQKDLRQSDEQVFMNTDNLMFPLTIEDVYDMAEATNTMDLVITVDTMTAHLAGAEGIPTWLLLPYAPDWRWGLEGDKTPWYPCMRIFRQGEDREWGPVIQRVVEELKNAEVR
jgi:hypothetical protein